MSRPRIATAWLDGCSGCHMSLLDMDEALVELAGQVDVVYSPTVDIKVFPEGVDVTLVEGAVSSEDDVHKIRTIRARTRVLVALGDCAVTGNVPSMRNLFQTADVLDRAYVENATVQPGRPTVEVPTLCAKVRPMHEVVKVDVFVPGCPPPPAAIAFTVTELLAGRTPDPSGLTRFGK
jgi:NAD-reducing hydrogenase small subunit